MARNEQVALGEWVTMVRARILHSAACPAFVPNKHYHWRDEHMLCDALVENEGVCTLTFYRHETVIGRAKLELLYFANDTWYTFYFPTQDLSLAYTYQFTLNGLSVVECGLSRCEARVWLSQLRKQVFTLLDKLDVVSLHNLFTAASQNQVSLIASLNALVRQNGD
jgi:hypothetical protein